MANTRQALAQPDIQWGNESLPPAVREKLNRMTQSIRSLIGEVQRLQQMLAGGSAGQVLEKNAAGDYAASWQDASDGTVVGGKNLGDGRVIFVGLVDGLLQFRSLIAGANIEIIPTGDSLSIAFSGSEGGTGTVTSVGINSADLDVAGSPVTTHGSITLAIKDGAVTYAKMQPVSADTVVLGRRAGEGSGLVEELTVTDLAAFGISSGYPPQLGYAGI